MSHFRIVEVVKNLCESEVREAHLEKALFFIWNQVISLPYVLGEIPETCQDNRNLDCCSGAEDGLGVLYAVTLFL